MDNIDSNQNIQNFNLMEVHDEETFCSNCSITLLVCSHFWANTRLVSS